jgi:amino acid transporter
MNQSEKQNSRLKNIFIGKSRNINDHGIFHKMSLIAVLAWVGLGADGLSSSCYGPEESIRALGAHTALAPFIALATVLTIVIICASYSQIIACFPSGGGGYLVASKLLSPTAGVVSGCALIVDYVLTIALSISSGADQLFSVLPAHWLAYKLCVALVATVLLTILNLRGVKESVMVWAPIFFLFLATHGFAIIYGFSTHFGNVTSVVASTTRDLGESHSQLGTFGILLLLLKSYSLGAGSYTGIEAVSNGLPILREPRVATGKRTMLYMGVSLGLMVGGLLFSYLLFHSVPQEGKTLNAILFEQITKTWPHGLAQTFIVVSMSSAAVLLFIAAQTGFLDGPRVLASMALDRWFPARFASLSDRFVSHNGILLMGGAAFILIFVSRGAVSWLVVLYSINVFITFSLSQLGMIRHWWNDRAIEPSWKSKLAINSIGFALTATILVALSIIKFHEGGWVTIVVTGILIGVAFFIRNHYQQTRQSLSRLDELVEAFSAESTSTQEITPPLDPKAKTAVIFVNGFNGLGVHTTLGIVQMFPGVYKNYVFVEIGIVDAGNFKGAEELAHLEANVGGDVRKYAECMRSRNIHAEARSVIGPEILTTAFSIGCELAETYPNATFFGGQLVFDRETYITRLLHNFTVFGMQREFFRNGMPFFVLPIRV